jgi:hypothetical protein
LFDVSEAIKRFASHPVKGYDPNIKFFNPSQLTRWYVHALVMAPTIEVLVNQKLRLWILAFAEMTELG